LSSCTIGGFSRRAQLHEVSFKPRRVKIPPYLRIIYNSLSSWCVIVCNERNLRFSQNTLNCHNYSPKVVRLYSEVIIGYSRCVSHSLAYISTKHDFYNCSLLQDSSLVLISTTFTAARNLIAIALILHLRFTARIGRNENLIVTYDPLKRSEMRGITTMYFF
jgi:hypothetical protein